MTFSDQKDLVGVVALTTKVHVLNGIRENLSSKSFLRISFQLGNAKTFSGISVFRRLNAIKSLFLAGYFVILLLFVYIARM